MSVMQLMSNVKDFNNLKDIFNTKLILGPTQDV